MGPRHSNEKIMDLIKIHKALENQNNQENANK